jgi:hypothetical protein
MSPKWSPVASEDLRAIGNSLVIAEIFYIASEELRPDIDDALEGPLNGNPDVRYRRCVRTVELHSYTSFELDDVDDFQSQACDYILIYRWLTKDEQINLRLSSGLVVVRVVSNVDLVPLLTTRSLRGT